MQRWNPQLFRKQASGVKPELLAHLLRVGRRITLVHKDVQPVFTLRHLAALGDVDYGFLRQTVARRTDSYTEFRIRKRVTENLMPQYRTICVPSPGLMKAQRWITQNILAHVPTHDGSVAFSKGNTLYKAVEPHCRAKWLVKIDVQGFFESISEASVYRLFESLGFEPLIAFEMARLCTRAPDDARHEKEQGESYGVATPYVIEQYVHSVQGHLPQGAPTSPMLANLVCRELDERLAAIAEERNLNYTRYADDLTFSSSDLNFGREMAKALIQLVYRELSKQGLCPNRAKTAIVPPSASKIVLGLSVEEETPRLTRHFKDLLRQHIHYLVHPEVGPVKHASARKFASVTGLRNHIGGLLAYAAQIEPDWAAKQRVRFMEVDWP
jgi:RNA-directed DNA polymerase